MTITYTTYGVAKLTTGRLVTQIAVAESQVRWFGKLSDTDKLTFWTNALDVLNAEENRRHEMNVKQLAHRFALHSHYAPDANPKTRLNARHESKKAFALYAEMGMGI